MLTALNSKQTDKLSNFFFDIAKGIVLGVLGFSVSFTDTPPFIRLLNVLVGVFMILFCVRVGLELIKND